MKEIHRTKTKQTCTGLLYLRGDMAQASAPIEWSDDGEVWGTTVFQTANAHHSWREAKRIVLAWCQRGNGLEVGTRPRVNLSDPSSSIRSTQVGVGGRGLGYVVREEAS